MNRIARFTNRNRKLTFALIVLGYGVGFYFAPMIAAGVLVIDLAISSHLVRSRIPVWNYFEEE